MSALLEILKLAYKRFGPPQSKEETEMIAAWVREQVEAVRSGPPRNVTKDLTDDTRYV